MVWHGILRFKGKEYNNYARSTDQCMMIVETTIINLIFYTLLYFLNISFLYKLKQIIHLFFIMKFLKVFDMFLPFILFLVTCRNALMYNYVFNKNIIRNYNNMFLNDLINNIN